MTGKWAFAWAVLLLLGLHALQPYAPFPFIDDFAYAPLTELWRDPGLYPRDTQIHMFVNHAWAYSLAYIAAKATVGLVPGFWVLTVILVIASGLALFKILHRLGGTLAEFPIVLVGTGLLVKQGIGRAEYGGFIAPFFHHQGIALCLGAWSFALLLGSRNAWAGFLLGLAAYAQPVTALHCAFAAGLAVLAGNQPILKRSTILAGTAIVTAVPLAILVISSRIVMDASHVAISTADLIDKAYIFRTPKHYALDGGSILLGWNWIAIGGLSLTVLRNSPLVRPAAGLLAGFALLLLATTLGHHVWQSHFLPLYILDVTRSSSLGFALASILFAAAFRHASHGEGLADTRSRACLWIALFLLLATLVFNGTIIAWIVAATGLIAMSMPRLAVPAIVALAATGLFLFVSLAPTRTAQRKLPPEDADLFAWIHENTSAEALFVIPPDMDKFRYYARRGIYADFKMFSVAQPAQAWLTRDRLQQISRPNARELKLTGWDGAAAWSTAYTRNATCKGITDNLVNTGADFFLRPASGKDGIASAPECNTPLQRVFSNGDWAIYRMTSKE